MYCSKAIFLVPKLDVIMMLFAIQYFYYLKSKCEIAGMRNQYDWGSVMSFCTVIGNMKLHIHFKEQTYQSPFLKVSLLVNQFLIIEASCISIKHT